MSSLSHKTLFMIYRIVTILTLCSIVSTTLAQIGVDNSSRQISNEEQKIEMSRSFRWWDLEISKKPYSWYKTEEGIRATENILSWQDEGTGWPLMNTIREPFTGDISKAGPWGKGAALNSSTVNELRFLSRAYQATENERYKTAILGGLGYILDAQLDSGGWPHSYPHRSTDYSHYATYNDNIISDIMTFLAEVLSSPDFRVIGEENLKKVKEAYEKGLEFILKSQLVVNGELTAWAQQYDETTYEPKAARKFEPVAISGDESAGVLLFLMSIRKPSEEVIAAIKAGVQWFKDVQIDGMELVKNSGDQSIRPNTTAPPLWARFYEIGTNRPIFAGRDGIIRYNLEEVELERRRGYSWYNYKGTAVLNRYNDWLYERQWDNQPPTNVEESKVLDFNIPEPLVTEEGNPVLSTKEWEKFRRPEILKLFEHHQHGIMPTGPVHTSFEVLELNQPGMNGKSLRTQVRIHFPDHQHSPVIRLLLNIPADATGPVPTLLHLSFSPNVLLFDEPGIDEGMAWNTRLKLEVPDREALLLKDIDPDIFIENGFGIATVYYGDIEPDFDGGRNYGVRSLFHGEEDRDPTEWGAIGAWAWGLSRVMDYLETNRAVDKHRIALSGVSRLGKTVLWAAACDQRFAMVIPIVSGEGGATISRRNYGETIADLTNPHRYHYWFAPRYADYAFMPDQLPVDGHMLLSLIAPRPVLQIVGTSDTWSDPKGEWIAAKAAEPVYALYGLEGLKIEEYPSPGTSILHDMGFFLHDAGHTVIPEDFEIMVKFMSKHFKNK